MAPYPTKDEIEHIFAQRGRPDKFNSYLDDNVEVTIPGEGFNLSAKHQGVQAFHEGTWGRVVISSLKEETFRVEVKRVIGGGDEAVSYRSFFSHFYLGATLLCRPLALKRENAW